MRFSAFIIGGIYFFIAVSCSSENWSDVLDRVPSNELFKNSRTGWELEQSRPSNGSWDYFLKKIDGDTTKSLVITNRNKEGKPGVLLYLVFYPCEKVSADTCVIELEPPADTLYFYRMRKGDKEFFAGEYAFKSMHLEFTSEERRYYMLHEDSLRRVKGDNLSPLPPLSQDEKKALDSVLQGWETPDAKDQD